MEIFILVCKQLKKTVRSSLRFKSESGGQYFTGKVVASLSYVCVRIMVEKVCLCICSSCQVVLWPVSSDVCLVFLMEKLNLGPLAPFYSAISF